MLRDILRKIDGAMQKEDGMKHDGIISELRDRKQEETPDFLDLKRSGFHPVFVYGTLKRGGRNHHILRTSPYMGRAETLAAGFMMGVCSSDFPVALISPQSRCRIEGQVFLADPKQMLMLDRLEGNGSMYNRRKVRCVLHEQKVRIVDCFMYIGDKDFWAGEKLAYRAGHIGEDGKTCLSFNHLQKSGKPFDDSIPF